MLHYPICPELIDLFISELNSTESRSNWLKNDMIKLYKFQKL